MTKETKASKKTETVSDKDAGTPAMTGFNLDAAVEDYSKSSKMQKNGIRHVDKATMERRLSEVHSIDMAHIHRYHEAMKDERSAIARLTSLDLTEAVTELRKTEDHDEAVRAAIASTSFWRHDGEETLSVIACDESGDSTIDEGGNLVPVSKHGRIRTSISGHDGLRLKTIEDVTARISGLFA